MLQDGRTITAPAILLAEVGSAIRRTIWDPVLGQAIVHVSPELARRGAEIAGQHALRGLDALYVATAEQGGDALVTLNDEQLQRGAAVVRTMRPDEVLG